MTLVLPSYICLTVEVEYVRRKLRNFIENVCSVGLFEEFELINCLVRDNTKMLKKRTLLPPRGSHHYQRVFMTKNLGVS